MMTDEEKQIRSYLSSVVCVSLKDNLLYLIDVGIAKIGDTINFLHNVKYEDREHVLESVSKLVDDLTTLQEIIKGSLSKI